jgi:serine phosphatase RsbU (regulator of sigma subunit)
LQTLLLQYINAGHNPPIYFSNSTRKIKFLSSGGYFLGFMNSPLDYEIGEEFLQANDFVLLYTDGVTECTNYKGKEFGMNRLVEFVMGNSKLDVKSFCDALYKTIVKYCQRKDLDDDVSVVGLKVK